MSRVDEAWNHDPRILWALIIEDEDTNNVAELGEAAERLFANAQEAWAENARLHAQVHSLCGMLDHERRQHHDQPGERMLQLSGSVPGNGTAVPGLSMVPEALPGPGS